MSCKNLRALCAVMSSISFSISLRPTYWECDVSSGFSYPRYSLISYLNDSGHLKFFFSKNSSNSSIIARGDS